MIGAVVKKSGGHDSGGVGGHQLTTDVQYFTSSPHHQSSQSVVATIGEIAEAGAPASGSSVRACVDKGNRSKRGRRTNG